MKIQTIFEAFEQFKIGHDNAEQLYARIVAGLEKVGNIFTRVSNHNMTFRYLPYQSLASQCSENLSFSIILGVIYHGKTP